MLLSDIQICVSFALPIVFDAKWPISMLACGGRDMCCVFLMSLNGIFFPTPEIF